MIGRAVGYAEDDRVREAQALGAGTCLKKPRTLERLAVASPAFTRWSEHSWVSRLAESAT